jgi:hypothetical protein
MDYNYHRQFRKIGQDMKTSNTYIIISHRIIYANLKRFTLRYIYSLDHLGASFPNFKGQANSKMKGKADR